MTNTNMNINVNVMCHALVVVVRRRVVSLMWLSAQSLWSLFSHSRWGRGGMTGELVLSAWSLSSLFSHSRWGREGMTGEPKLCADQGVCYWSETIKR
jgi:hypothetical protein